MAKQKTIKAGEPKKSFAQGLAERMNLYICPVLLGALGVFIATYIPLMLKFFRIFTEQIIVGFRYGHIFSFKSGIPNKITEGKWT